MWHRDVCDWQLHTLRERRQLSVQVQAKLDIGTIKARGPVDFDGHLLDVDCE